ncbi:hypothetical protein [Mycolicibacterium parafortuitum]
MSASVQPAIDGWFATDESGATHLITANQGLFGHGSSVIIAR